ncbi:hypothetical protein QJQ45_017640 [Haematococcus lacustris]|nr:hypothetical protein QJQ45_017640 [Haematococcus lacustris]
MHPASPQSQTHRYDQDREALQLALVVLPADGLAYSHNQGVGVDATARVGTPTPRDIPQKVAEDGQAYDTDRQASACKGGTSDAASGPGFWRLVARGQWQAVRQAAWAFARQRDNQVLVGAACLAGITSGLMDGLTGMGGPPIMLLYTCLDTPKAVARAVGAVVNLTQIRLLAYWSLGMLHQEDMLMFGSASVLHLAACSLGALVLFQHLDQKRFGQLLFALMLTCCFLLFAAATGLTGAGLWAGQLNFTASLGCIGTAMQRIGESRWRPLELCWWPEHAALPAQGKAYPGLGYKRVQDRPPKAHQQQPAGAQYLLPQGGCEAVPGGRALGMRGGLQGEGGLLGPPQAPQGLGLWGAGGAGGLEGGSSDQAGSGEVAAAAAAAEGVPPGPSEHALLIKGAPQSLAQQKAEVAVAEVEGLLGAVGLGLVPCS